MRIFVGNLPWDYSSEDLRRLFKEYGDVNDASVIRDRASGRSRGFGFVTMASTRQFKTAIESLNGATVKGRELKVNPARPRNAAQLETQTG